MSGMGTTWSSCSWNTEQVVATILGGRGVGNWSCGAAERGAQKRPVWSLFVTENYRAERGNRGR